MEATKQAQSAASGVTASRDRWAERHQESRFELGADGRMLGANNQAEEMLRGGGVHLIGGKLRLGSMASNRSLDHALQRTFEEAHRAKAGHRRIVVRLSDGAWRAADIYAEPDIECALLVIHGAGAPAQDAMGALSEAFGLTPCETDVLTMMSAGECPKDIARALDLSQHTVRSHLRSLYSKLGVRGASNAIRLTLQLLS